MVDESQPSFHCALGWWPEPPATVQGWGGLGGEVVPGHEPLVPPKEQEIAQGKEVPFVELHIQRVVG